MDPADATEIPWAVYCRMLEDARRQFGSAFQQWVGAVTDGVDGYYYLVPSSWADLFRLHAARSGGSEE